MKLFIMRSLNHNDKIGIIKAWYLLLKYAPPNKAMAPIGVKLGMWGIILVKEANNINKIIPINDKFILVILNKLKSVVEVCEK